MAVVLLLLTFCLLLLPLWESVVVLCFVVRYFIDDVHSSIAFILMRKRELIALLNLSSWCLVMVERLFLTVPWGCLQFLIVVFPDHTHLLFLNRCHRHFTFPAIVTAKMESYTNAQGRIKWVGGRGVAGVRTPLKSQAAIGSLEILVWTLLEKQLDPLGSIRYSMKYFDDKKTLTDLFGSSHERSVSGVRIY